MCGIAGILDTRRGTVDPATLVSMREAMAHRGPDGFGLYADGPVGLAHRRLAIIDLTGAGEQPMASEDGSVVVVFNGEILNFPRLRAELVALGHVFRSHSDTEVLVHGYEQWGRDVVSRLNGMFAFALWDRRKSELFAARDRYGVKPLYYTYDRGRLCFASEVKALIAAQAWSGQVDRQALVEYFTFQNVLSDRTLFDGVRLLPAGHSMRLAAGDGMCAVERYWDFEFTAGEHPDTDYECAVESVRDLMEASVERHMLSDVPVGSYLSGGMDSGSLVALSRGRVDRLMTFTGGFDLSLARGLEQNFDERSSAEAMASLFVTDHYEMVIHAGSMARVMPELIWHLEDLRVGMSYQNYYIAQLASRFVKVVLSGCGGDEIFAGYPWRYASVLDADSPGDTVRRSYSLWERLVPAGHHEAFFEPEILRGLDRDITRSVFLDVAGGFDPRGREWSPSVAADFEMYIEAKTFLHGLLLVEDKLSSAHALEARVPFLDNELVDFVLALPTDYKMDIASLQSAMRQHSTGTHVSSDGKLVLRDAMRGVLPDSVLSSQKQGFSTPEGSWYRSSSTSYVRDLLLSPRALSRGYFRSGEVSRVIDEHERGISNHRLLIWSLLSFEWWNRVFIDGEAPRS